MKPTERFSSRAEAYARFRPTYPQKVVDVLEAEAGLWPGASIADIGAGTGLSSALFLRRGYQVTAVEPNAEMRAKAVASLGAEPRFSAVSGTAEATGLASQSVDCVLCAQAFHWFRLAETKAEMYRILKSGGVIAVMWNLRRPDTSEFLHELEAALLRYCPAYADRILQEHDVAQANALALAPEVHLHHTFWEQEMDRAALIGRMESASCVPQLEEPNHDEFFATVNGLVDRHADANGMVRLLYDTRLYWARV
jgi:SAM-dependent methyltransferase